MTFCCSQERPHLVCPYDDKPHWVARRAKRGADGLVAWERMPTDEWGDQVLTLAQDLVAAGHAPDIDAAMNRLRDSLTEFAGPFGTDKGEE